MSHDYLVFSTQFPKTVENIKNNIEKDGNCLIMEGHID